MLSGILGSAAAMGLMDVGILMSRRCMVVSESDGIMSNLGMARSSSNS